MKKAVKPLSNLALLLCLVIPAVAGATIVDKPGDERPSTVTGGIAVPSTTTQPPWMCWLDGRLIADESDPYLLSYGLADRPVRLRVRRADGTRTFVTTFGRMPSACFGKRHR